MKARITLYLDTRKVQTNAPAPVKLRVYLDRTQIRHFSTGEYLTEESFNKAYLSTKPRGEHKIIKDRLDAIKVKADNTIQKLQDRFSFDAFEKILYRSPNSSDDLRQYFQSYIVKLEKSGQAGTASSYSCSFKSIEDFIALKRQKLNAIPFSFVTADFLNDYEKWMINKGNSLTTVGIYLRNLRSILNLAIEAGDIYKEDYPFGKRKYQIPNSRKTKKALDKTSLGDLFRFNVPEGSSLEKARDFWFFSYQCNGINFRDISELKFKSISPDFIVFVRNKTKNSMRQDQQPIMIAVTDFVKEIITKYGNTNREPENYVFPVFTKGMSEREKLRANQNFTRFVNTHIKKLAKLAGITEDLSTYWARHSYTTTAIRNGASMEYIQESLGHQSISTTQNYWAGFEQHVKADIANKLMDF